MAVRQDLTEEWSKRGVTKENDFAILTAEISKASFGMTPNEYNKNSPLGATPRTKVRGFYAPRLEKRVFWMRNFALKCGDLHPAKFPIKN